MQAAFDIFDSSIQSSFDSEQESTLDIAKSMIMPAEKNNFCIVYVRLSSKYKKSEKTNSFPRFRKTLYFITLFNKA